MNIHALLIQEDDTKWEKLKSWLLCSWLGSIYCSVGGFFERAKKAYDYAKYSWTNYDFDSTCAIDLFAWKLQRIADHLREHDIIVGCDEYAQEIDAVVILLERVAVDDYWWKYEAVLEHKYGKHKHWFTPHKHGSEWHSKYERETEENKEQIRQEFLAFHIEAAKERERDLQRAFNLIVKQYFFWWD